MSSAPSPSAPPRWFGTDGVRGLVGEGALTAPNVRRMGQALGRWLDAEGARGDEGPRALLAMDSRPSGPDLMAQLAGGLVAAGVRVLDAGLIPTPALAWLMADGGFDLGVMISASHNPAPYNGLKPFAAGGRKLTDEEERAIEALLPEADGATEDELPPRDMHARHRYVDATVALLEAEGRLEGTHLVLDLAHGAATTTAPFVLQKLGATLEILHAAGEGVINDACGSEHPEAWLKAVSGCQTTAGLAFDGDADRILLATPGGELLDGDDMLAILAEDAQAREGLPANAVVSTVMANLGLEDRLAELDARLLRTPVGDRHVAERMRGSGAIYGGEPSGHLVSVRKDLPAPALIGDALVAAVRILQASRRLEADLATLRARRPRHPQTLIGVRVEEKRPISEWPALRDAIAAEEARFGDAGRLVVRYSGTEPLLRIMAEGRDAAAVDAAVERLRQVAEQG